ncbi:uncharacterized protein [Littorina saxatilis]|uniref:uncharacterized protein n=1 Tax=Littorina saxatilis TaxID=31220 RepID=UPI0038B5CC59
MCQSHTRCRTQEGVRTAAVPWSTCIALMLLLALGFQEGVCTEDCGRIFTALSGVFDSPNYPSDYHNNQDCFYLISLPPGHHITLTFLNFTLQPRSCGDFVQVFDGNSTSSPHFGHLCGLPTTLKNFRTTQNEMLVRFHSDYQETNTGFSVSYSSDTLGDRHLISAIHDTLVRVDSTTHAGTNQLNIKVAGLRSLEFDVYDYIVFWIQRNDSRIHSVFVNGTGQRVIADIGENSELSDIAFDAPSDLIFYLDRGNDVIGVVTGSGDVGRRLITTELHDQSKIALDTNLGKMYWTVSSTVQSADYDGSDNTTFFSVSEDRTVRSVAVDSKYGDVYVLDTSEDNATIHRLDRYGGNLSLLHSNNQHQQQITRLLFYHDRIYYITVNENNTERPSEVDSITRDGFYVSEFHTINFVLEDFSLYNESAFHQAQTECRRNKTAACAPDEICIPLPGNRTTCISSDRAYPLSGTTARDNDFGQTTLPPIGQTTIPPTGQTTLPPTVNTSLTATPFHNVSAVNDGNDDDDDDVTDADDERVAIVGGVLGAFGLVVSVVLVIIVIKRKGRSQPDVIAMDDVNVTPEAHDDSHNSTPPEEVEEHYEKLDVLGATIQEEDDYVLPIHGVNSNVCLQ